MVKTDPMSIDARRKDLHKVCLRIGLLKRSQSAASCWTKRKPLPFCTANFDLLIAGRAGAQTVHAPEGKDVWIRKGEMP
jgi:hypothetical protein